MALRLRVIGMFAEILNVSGVEQAHYLNSIKLSPLPIYAGVLLFTNRHQYIVERIPLFGGDNPEERGAFEPRTQQVFVIRGKAAHDPDLLLITSYEASNGDYARVF